MTARPETEALIRHNIAMEILLHRRLRQMDNAACNELSDPVGFVRKVMNAKPPVADKGDEQ